MLTIKHVILAVAAADLRLIGHSLIELLHDLSDTLRVQFSLIGFSRDDQLGAVNGHLTISTFL